MSSGTTSMQGMGSIMKFAQKTRQCLGCKAILKVNDRALCSHCSKDEARIYMKQLEKVREYEQLYSRVWVQCM